MTTAALDKLRLLLRREIKVAGEAISFEIQEDGQFLLISIPVDALPEPPDAALGQRIASLVDDIVPQRPDDDSWMLVFTQSDKVVDSFSGGNLASAA